MNLFKPLGALRRLLPVRANNRQQRCVSIKSRPARAVRTAALQPISLLDAFDGLYAPRGLCVEPVRHARHAPAAATRGVPDWLAAVLALPAVFLGINVIIKAYNGACLCL